MNTLFDLSYLKKNLNSDENELLVLLNIFLETIPKTIDELNQNLQAQEYLEISKLAHRLKTTIDLFCIKDLEKEIRELESLAKVGIDQDRITFLTNNVIKTLSEVIIQIGEERTRLERTNNQVLH